MIDAAWFHAVSIFACGWVCEADKKTLRLADKKVS